MNLTQIGVDGGSVGDFLSVCLRVSALLLVIVVFLSIPAIALGLHAV